MGNILYLVAFVFIIVWAIGYLGFHAGSIIHILLAFALVAILIRIVRGNKPFLGQH